MKLLKIFRCKFRYWEGNCSLIFKIRLSIIIEEYVRVYNLIIDLLSSPMK